MPCKSMASTPVSGAFLLLTIHSCFGVTHGAINFAPPSFLSNPAPVNRSCCAGFHKSGTANGSMPAACACLHRTSSLILARSGSRASASMPFVASEYGLPPGESYSTRPSSSSLALISSSHFASRDSLKGLPLGFFPLFSEYMVSTSLIRKSVQANDFSFGNDGRLDLDPRRSMQSTHASPSPPSINCAFSLWQNTKYARPRD
mmetsp:Transcript_24614/g.59353  ORF Transcript_24614/g.59353 Transcript_24614/m.59353 type:complete len:203 (-) Transcript_24614:539-1147(-)